MRGSLLGSKALKQTKYNNKTVNKNKTIFFVWTVDRQEKIEAGGCLACECP